MRVNFACGKQTWDGWYCVDAQQHSKASRPVDLLHAFRFDGKTLLNSLPIYDQQADEVHAYHFIEHVYAWEAPAVIREFRRILKPGGRLVLELPNLEKACKNLLQKTTDQYSMWPLYGDPGTMDPFMCHRWGYTPKTITALLKGAGFKRIAVLPPQTHGARKNRDMRVEAA
jgi:predicted SAM-dependent methyltransferase